MTKKQKKMLYRIIAALAALAAGALLYLPAIAAAPHTDEYAVVSYNSAPLPENITNIPQNIYASIKYLTKGAARPDTAEIYSSNVEIFSSDAFAPII